MTERKGGGKGKREKGLDCHVALLLAMTEKWRGKPIK